MLKPTGLISGHYECRSFAESLPILKEFLALEVIDERNTEKIVKHPNTGWQLIVHANGADAPIKSMRNHYGVRVSTNAEVDRATEYLEQKKDQFGIKIIKPRENHNAYSVHFYEPGGNYWEIESYEHAVEHGMGQTTNPHWTKTISELEFSRPRIHSPGSNSWHSGKRRSGGIRTILPRSAWTGGRKALAELVLRQTSRHAVVRRLHQSAERQSPHAVALPALHDRARVALGNPRGASRIYRQSRGLETALPRRALRIERRRNVPVCRPERQLVGNYQRSILGF